MLHNNRLPVGTAGSSSDWRGAAILFAIGLISCLLMPARTNRDSAPASDNQGQALYVQHCAACHGDAGNGDGPAARFLYPKPRHFGEAKFRLTSTVNSMPTDDDLMRVITRGMSGSAMFPFGHLSEPERRSLVSYVRELTLSSLIEIARRESEKSGDAVNLDELKRDAAEVLKPGDRVAIPANWPQPDATSIARGKEHYLKTCAACHGATGKGDGVQDQRNSDGTPTAPRDFTRGIFKGGRERDQLYVRIALGMAGTPMPATQDLKPGDMADLVNFIQSLSPADAQDRVEHKRTTVVARRVPALDPVIPDAVWATASPARIVVSPLWWRNYSERDFTVRAIHDGKSLAVRLTWNDETRDDRMTRPEDFEDMAAVQLFAGTTEPFLGMGAANAPLDMWLWRASWQNPRDLSESQLDDYPFDAPYYRERLKALGKPLPDFQTARAAGNPNARGDDATASNLTAKGFGSTTFRPKPSQVVTAKSNWKDGVWTVELRRPLSVAPSDGLSLTSGGRCSIGFAIWDGAARDRNGQKLVSIWHDLRIE